MSVSFQPITSELSRRADSFKSVEVANDKEYLYKPLTNVRFFMTTDTSLGTYTPVTSQNLRLHAAYDDQEIEVYNNTTGTVGVRVVKNDNTLSSNVSIAAAGAVKFIYTKIKGWFSVTLNRTLIG